MILVLPQRMKYCLSFCILFVVSFSFVQAQTQSICDLDGPMVQAPVVDLGVADIKGEVIITKDDCSSCFQYIPEYYVLFEDELAGQIETHASVTSIANTEVWSINTSLQVGNQTLNGVEEICSYLNEQTDLGIVYAQPNYDYPLNDGAGIDALPNDSLQAAQNYLGGSNSFGSINAVGSWDITPVEDVIVAVLDGEIDLDHEDLEANILPAVPTGSVSPTTSTPTTIHLGRAFQPSHGTAVAGIIAAVANNQKGITGVCPNAKIYPATCFNGGGKASVLDIVAQIDNSIQKGAKVINCSWGGFLCTDSPIDSLLFKAFQRAALNDVLVVCSAGNPTNLDGLDIDSYNYFPANFDLPNIISVMSSDALDNPLGNYGAENVDIAAPGENIFTTVSQDNYDYVSGASFAVPQVSAAAAQLWSVYPELTAVEVKEKIICRADAVDALLDKNQAGGRLNLTNIVAPERVVDIWTGYDCSEGPQLMSSCKIAGASLAPTVGLEAACHDLTDACGVVTRVCRDMTPIGLDGIHLGTLPTGDIDNYIFQMTGFEPKSVITVCPFTGEEPYVHIIDETTGKFAVCSQQGDYWKVVVTNPNGSSWTFNNMLQQLKSGEATDLGKVAEESFSIETLIYPNPCQEFLNLEAEIIGAKDSTVHLAVYNQMGQLVKNFELEITEGSDVVRKRLDTREFESGLYILQLTCGPYNSASKFYKE